MIYMFGKKSVLPYMLISLVFIFLGTLVSSDLVWELTDTANYLMVLPNVIGLVAGTALTVKLLKEGKETVAKKSIQSQRPLHPERPFACVFRGV